MSAVTTARAEKSGWVAWVIRLAVACAILYIIFGVVSFPNVVEPIAAATPAWVFGAWALALAQVGISASRLKILTDRQGMRLSVGKITEISLVAQFYGLFLPGELAQGAVRWYRMSSADSRAGGSGGATAPLVAIVLSRLIFTAVLLLVGVVFLVLDGRRASLVFGVVLAALLVGGVGICLLLFRPAVVDRLARITRPRIVRRFLEKSVAAARSFQELPRATWIRLTTLAFLENAVGVFSFYCMVRALSLDVSFETVAWVRSMIQIATVIPVSLAGIGIREGGFILALEPYAVVAADAVALSLLVFSRLLFLMALGGVLEARPLVFPGRRDGSLPLWEGKDLFLIFLAPWGWILPRGLWHGFGRLTAGVASFVGGEARQRRVRRLRRVIGDCDGLPDAAAIDANLQAGIVEQFLQNARELRPSGLGSDGFAKVRLTGHRHIRRSIRTGRGTIFWVAPFLFSGLVTKKAWHAAGYSVIHLSRVEHGPSDSRFGMLTVNRVRVAGESRYLAERLAMTPGSELKALRRLEKSLQRNEIISITASDGGVKTIPGRFFEGRIAIATGAPGLALATGAHLLPVLTLRDGDADFEVRTEAPLRAPESGSRRCRVSSLVDQFCERLERASADHPLCSSAWRYAEEDVTVGEERDD